LKFISWAAKILAEWRYLATTENGLLNLRYFSGKYSESEMDWSNFFSTRDSIRVGAKLLTPNMSFLQVIESCSWESCPWKVFLKDSCRFYVGLKFANGNKCEVS